MVLIAKKRLAINVKMDLNLSNHLDVFFQAVSIKISTSKFLYTKVLKLKLVDLCMADIKKQKLEIVDMNQRITIHVEIELFRPPWQMLKFCGMERETQLKPKQMLRAHSLSKWVHSISLILVKHLTSQLEEGWAYLSMDFKIIAYIRWLTLLKNFIWEQWY